MPYLHPGQEQRSSETDASMSNRPRRIQWMSSSVTVRFRGADVVVEVRASAVCFSGSMDPRNTGWKTPCITRGLPLRVADANLLFPLPSE